MREKAPRGILRILWATLLAASCGPSSSPAPKSGSLGGAVARVGEAVLPRSLVAGVASVRRVTPHAALGAVLEDALLAEQARREHLADGADRARIAWQLQVALARRVPEHLLERAWAAGPPTDDELSLRTVVHFVVRRSAERPAEEGLSLAAELAAAVAGSASADDFESKARRAAPAGPRVVVERVGPFGADGRGLNGERFDPLFVAAAFALGRPASASAQPGATSGIVETPFGWHVIRLVEATAPAPAALQARRRDLTEAVIALRGRIAMAEILRTRRKRTPVEVESGLDALLGGF